MKGDTKTLKLRQKIEEAADFIVSRCKSKPQVAIILGTGLGPLAKKIGKSVKIDYSDIPYFPETTFSAHAGNLIIGELGGKAVVAMEGRYHFYEGHSLEEITFPVRVLRKLGAETLIVTNAAGGMNLAYKKGDLVIIEDHINFMGVNPLIGPNDDKLGPRFPDMCEPYSRKLIEKTKKVAEKLNIDAREGVYIGVTGPNLETRAEYKFMRQIGADVVGMSTVPEVIVGVHCGFKILGISIITDLCDPDHLEPVNIESIIAAANEGGDRLNILIENLLKEL